MVAGGNPVWNGSHFEHPLILQPGNNSIALLSATIGLSYAGPFYEKEEGGLRGSVMLSGDFGVINLTEFQWIHEVRDHLPSVPRFTKLKYIDFHP